VKVTFVKKNRPALFRHRSVRIIVQVVNAIGSWRT